MQGLLIPRNGGAQRAAQLVVSSPSLLHIRWDVPAWSSVSGVLLSRSGHDFTWSRNGGTAAAVTDSNGVSYTPPAIFPGYTSREIVPEGEVARRVTGLRTIIGETLTCASVAPHAGWSGLIRFIPVAPTTHVSEKVILFGVGTGVNTDPYFQVGYDESAEEYFATYYNGTTSVTSVSPWLATPFGEEVTLRWNQLPTGELTLWSCLNRGEELPPMEIPSGGGGFFSRPYLGWEAFSPEFFLSGEGEEGGTIVTPDPDTTAAIALAPWASGTQYRINGIFGAANGLPGVHYGVLILPASADPVYLRSLWE